MRCLLFREHFIRYEQEYIRIGVKITNWYVIAISNLFNIYTRNLSVYSRGENWGWGKENNDKICENIHTHTILYNVLFTIVYRLVYFTYYTHFTTALAYQLTLLYKYTRVLKIFWQKKQKKKKNK